MAKKPKVKTAKNNIRVEPHIGKTNAGADVEFDQCLVFIGRRQVGYCGRRPGCPLNLIVTLSEAETSRVLDAVTRHVGHVSLTSTAPELVETDEE